MKKLPLVLSALVVIGSIAVIIWSCCTSSARIAHHVKRGNVREQFQEKKVLGKDWSVKPVEVKAVKASPAAVKPKKEKVRKQKETDDWQEYTPEEEQLVDEIHDALDEESVDRMVALAAEAAKSTNPTVRSEMVDALKFMDDKVLPELLMFIEDPDEDVRIDAGAAFEQAVLNIDEDVEKAKVIAIAMGSLKNADTVRELGQGLAGMDDAIIREALEYVLEGENEVGRKIAEELADDLLDEEEA